MINAILYLIFILFPFFCLTTTQELYSTNKLYLLAFSAVIFLLFSTLHLLSSKKIIYKRSPLDLPVILFVLTVAISIIISSPNKVQAILNPNFGLLSILSLTIIYFYISKVYGGWRGEKKEAKVHIFYDLGGADRAELGSTPTGVKNIVSSLSIISLVLSILTIILFFQPFKNLPLPQNLQFLKSPAFTPIGSQLDLAIFLGFFTILGLTQILKRINTDDKNTKYFILNTLYFLLPLIALTLTAYIIIKPASANFNQFELILTPFSHSWYAAVETLKNPLTALFGVGVDNFPSIFTKVKDINYNLSSYWNINSFIVSRSTVLHILTETGLFGLISFSLIILTLFNMIFAPVCRQEGIKKQTHTDNNYFLPSIIYLLVIMLLFPPSLPVFFLFYITLGLINNEVLSVKNADLKLMAREAANYRDEHTPTSLLHERKDVFEPIKNKTVIMIAFIVGLFFIITATYFLIRSYSAEYYFRKSLDGYTTNNFKVVYDNQKKAISLNPYIERFRAAFSQTNIVLANNFSAKGEKMTDLEKQSLTQAIKTAIDEAKAVTTLNPQKASNWENLATVYRNIIGAVEGADVWTVSAYQRAVALDPQNPNYRLNLGGIYYAYGKYDDASRFFEQTIELKPNLANAYYNLAWSSYKKGDYKKAVNSMQNALILVNPTTAKTDYEKAQSELEEFKKMLPEEEGVSTLETEEDQPEFNLPSLAPMQSQPIVEITP